MLNPKGMRFPIEVMLVWGLAGRQPIYCAIATLQKCGRRGAVADHSSINRWTIRLMPLLEQAFPQSQPLGRQQLAQG